VASLEEILAKALKYSNSQRFGEGNVSASTKSHERLNKRYVEGNVSLSS